MNCSYRILENVYIGHRVRKTSGKGTVPYKNEPVTDVYIERWDKQGFLLKSEKFPTPNNTIWLDFDQLPLNQLNIEMGYIKNPIVFVEAITRSGGVTSMVLLRADTFDYLELLEDKKDKETRELLSPNELDPGDVVISSICREGNRMIFLGIFHESTLQLKHNMWGYSHSKKRWIYPGNSIKRAFFLFENDKGGYNLRAYPLSNKIVKEVFKVDKDPVALDFRNEEKNIDLIMKSVYLNRSSDYKRYNYLEVSSSYLNECKENSIKIENSYCIPIFIQKSKKNHQENFYNFILKNTEPKRNLVKSEEYAK